MTVASRRPLRWARPIAAAAALVLAVVVLARQWPGVSESLALVGWGPPLVALVVSVLAVGASFAAWRRTLAALGSATPARQGWLVFTWSQLGKYLPGSIWPAVAQMELGRDLHVPRSRSAAAYALNVLITLSLGAALGLVSLPTVVADLPVSPWLLAPVVALAVALHPRLLNPVVDWALKVLRRPGLDRPIRTRDVGVIGLWSLVAWFGYGIGVYVLALPLVDGSGLSPLFVVCGYALAWVCGFLVVFAPAGLGVREAVLVAVLTPALSVDEALTVALLSRAAVTAADVLAALAAMAANPGALRAVRGRAGARPGRGQADPPRPEDGLRRPAEGPG